MGLHNRLNFDHTVCLHNISCISKDLVDVLPCVYSTGVITEDVAMFGNSWTEEEPHQASCTMVPSLYPSPCATQDAHTLLVLCHAVCELYVFQIDFVMPIIEAGFGWRYLLLFVVVDRLALLAFVDRVFV